MAIRCWPLRRERLPSSQNDDRSHQTRSAGRNTPLHRPAGWRPRSARGPCSPPSSTGGGEETRQNALLQVGPAAAMGASALEQFPAPLTADEVSAAGPSRFHRSLRPARQWPWPAGTGSHPAAAGTPPGSVRSPRRASSRLPGGDRQVVQASRDLQLPEPAASQSFGVGTSERADHPPILVPPGRTVAVCRAQAWLTTINAPSSTAAWGRSGSIPSLIARHANAHFDRRWLASRGGAGKQLGHQGNWHPPF